MADEIVMPLAEKTRRCRALFLADPGPRPGAAAVTGASARSSASGPARRWLDRAGSQRGAGRAPPISSATRPISTASRRAPASAPRQRQPGRNRPRARMPWRWPPRGAGSRSSPAAIRASSPWPRRCSRRSRPASRPGARSTSPWCRASPRCRPPRPGSARRSGHDFCAISLSDNLKPWAIVERRLRAAAEGDFVIALYNPASKARPRADPRGLRLLRALQGRGDAGRLRPRCRPRGRADRR